jgi:hypothetical protein
MLTGVCVGLGAPQGDKNKGVWMTLNGGLLQLTSTSPKLDDDKLEFKDVKIRSGGYGAFFFVVVVT